MGCRTEQTAQTKESTESAADLALPCTKCHNALADCTRVEGGVVRVTLYLLRGEKNIDNVVLARAERYLDVPLADPPDGVQWRLLINQRPTSPVSWLKTLRPIVQNSDNLLVSGQSAGAVLLISSSERTFAMTFGTGFHAVKEEDIEPDFGLRVVANSVDPAKLTRAETRGLQKGTKNSATSLPVPNEVFALDLATGEEWIRKFGGQVADKTFASSVAGADSLQLTLKDFELTDLPGKLEAVLNSFKSTQYRDRFPFLDYFRRLPAKAPQVATLDLKVHELFANRSDDLGFAAPHEFGLYDPDHFIFRANRQSVEVPELTAENVYGALDDIGGWENPLDWTRVDAVGSGGDAMDLSTRLWQYVVANVTIDAGRYKGNYTLTAGAWFKIDDNYSQRLDRFMQDRVIDSTDEVSLPIWDEQDLIDKKIPGEYGEERYNNFAGGKKNWAVLDRDLYRGDVGEKVEVCDLLSPNRLLVCVKRMDGASAMSHLFQQGSVSASLMYNVDYQKKVLEALKSVGGDGTFGSASDWTFVFAIATSKPGTLHQTMTFFSKVALMTHQEAIESRGFKVSIARIQRHAVPTTK